MRTRIQKVELNTEEKTKLIKDDVKVEVRNFREIECKGVTIESRWSFV